LKNSLQACNIAELGLKQLRVDPENYHPANCLPKELMAILIQAEDPHFLRHKGVSVYFLGLAVATNFSTGKFTRGGSTITMQLVRNLWLNKEKYMMRKLEEIILALLLENYADVSKTFILDAYTNLIEMAPSVNGIVPAAQFYFGKPATELSVAEMLVLTYIIPRPVHFYGALINSSETLAVNLYKYLREMSTIFIQKKVINADTFTMPDKIQFSKQFGSMDLKVTA
jgi:membrane peptidoglycan carboxypeptidase